MLFIPEILRFCTAFIQLLGGCEFITGWIEWLNTEFFISWTQKRYSLSPNNTLFFTPSFESWFCSRYARRCTTVPSYCTDWSGTSLRPWRLRWCKRYAAMEGLQYTGWRDGGIEALISEATGSRTLRYGLVCCFYVAQIRKYFLEKEQCLPSTSTSTMAQW